MAAPSLLIADFVEKLARIDLYLRELSRIVLPEELPFVHFLRDQWRGVHEVLRGTVKEVARQRQSISRGAAIAEDELRRLHSEISGCLSLRFTAIHPRLALVSQRPKISRIVYKLIDSTKPTGWLHDESPAIVFTDVYNYEQRTLRSPLTLKPGERIVIAIPYADVQNVKSWPLLLHEIGHARLNEALTATAVVGRIMQATGSQLTGMQQRAFQVWTAEFLSDLVAVHLVGSSVICALVSVALTRSPTSYRFDDHPQWQARVDVLRSYRDRMHLGKGPEEEYLELFEQACSIYHVARQVDFRSDSPWPAEVGGPAIPGLTTGMYLDILFSEFEAMIGDLPCAIVTDDAKGLRAGLANGIPMSMVAPDAAMARTIIGEWKQAKGSEGPQVVEGILGKLESRPASLPDVLSSVWGGWLDRIDDGVELLCRSVHSPDAFEEAYWDSVERMDTFDWLSEQSVEQVLVATRVRPRDFAIDS